MNALTSQPPAPQAPSATEPAGPLVVPEIVTGLATLADAALIVAAALFAWLLSLTGITTAIAAEDRYALVTILAAILFVSIVRRGRGYTLPSLADRRAGMLLAALAWGGTLALLLMLGFVVKRSGEYSRAWMLVWTVASLASLLGMRALIAWRIGAWTRAGRFRRTVAVVGPHAEALAGRLATDASVAILGVFDEGPPRPGIAGQPASLLTVARTTRLDEIILAAPLEDEATLARLVELLHELPADLRLAAPSLAAASLGQAPPGTFTLGGIPMLVLVECPLRRWSAAVKRAEDCVLGAVLLVIAAPVMLLTALAVLATSGRPVLFRQDRFGFNNKRIGVLKFRTMHADTDPTGARATTEGDKRVTRLGRFLRAWSLDELPQLINVMRGDMSLVGPRPHAVAMEVGGSPYEAAVAGYFRRHRVRPGMTGLAQVRGLRGELTGTEDAERRLRADLDYIERWSLGLDLVILLRTAGIVLSRRNAY